ncbi:MAG TPA: caspase family protein [Pyrinomonadaceae bacterium]
MSLPWQQAIGNQNNRQLDRQPVTAGKNERRTALVIGNGVYTNIPPLKNPSNDAVLVATTLRELSFDVSVATNKSQREMKQLIRGFGQQLRANGGVGLFYFAGHGVQLNGRNFLIPVDADIQNEADLEDVGIDVNYVLNRMAVSQTTLNIVILDACRNNPFVRSFRSTQVGLAGVKAPTGTLIAYATAPDSVAFDGDSTNSPYTEELTKQLRVPGVVLETTFRLVTERVSERTGGRQEPWTADNHKGEFYFKSTTNSSTSLKTNEPAKIDPVAVEREYWEAIRSSSDVQDYKSYLQTYPDGAYAAIARTKIRQIETSTHTKNASKLATPDSGLVPTSADWKTFRPNGEGFSVLMPRPSVTEARRSVYRGSILYRNVYRSQLGRLPFFLVISASGIDSKRSDAEKFDSYVDAFRYWLPEVYAKRDPALLKLVGENTLNGKVGREYQVTLGDSSGTARAYFKGGRFYIAVALDVSNAENLAKQFFDSFVLH